MGLTYFNNDDLQILKPKIVLPQSILIIIITRILNFMLNNLIITEKI